LVKLSQTALRGNLVVNRGLMRIRTSTLQQELQTTAYFSATVTQPKTDSAAYVSSGPTLGGGVRLHCWSRLQGEYGAWNVPRTAGIHLTTRSL